MRLLLIFRLVVLLVVGLPCWAAEGLLHSREVIAFIGGEAMAVAAESGELEVEMLRLFPKEQLHFRSLAWEGDTVFEQRRDLNFPPLETQLETIDTAMVVAQFGEMESLHGVAGLAEFVAAYEQLIDRVSGHGRRQVVLIGPFAAPTALDRDLSKHAELRNDYAGAVQQIAQRRGYIFVDAVVKRGAEREGVEGKELERQNLWTWTGRSLAQRLSGKLGLAGNSEAEETWATMRPLIRAKNRLWFNYWRPQNWAFLNGDRTAQPSSRDHLDPSKRWFPTEMEQYVPLIEAKEQAISQLASNLATK